MILHVDLGWVWGLVWILAKTKLFYGYGNLGLEFLSARARARVRARLLDKFRVMNRVRISVRIRVSVGMRVMIRVRISLFMIRVT